MTTSTPLENTVVSAVEIAGSVMPEVTAASVEVTPVIGVMPFSKLELSTN